MFFSQDKKADLIVSTYVDTVLEKVCKNLGVEIMDYSTDDDPTKGDNGDPQEWTIQPEWVKEVEKRHTDKLKAYRELARKRKSGGGVDKAEGGDKKEKIGD